MKNKLLLSLIILASAFISNAQIENLHNFTNGDDPYGTLIGAGDTLYGMTYSGGVNNQGYVFSVRKDGTGFKDIWDFYDSGSAAANGQYSLPFNSNGASPTGSLTISGHKLYGMTEYGGTNDEGVVFSINTNGTGYTDLWDFDDDYPYDSNGAYPEGGLLLVGNRLYGMTIDGGKEGYGNVFKLNINGGLTAYKDLIDFYTDSTGNAAYPNGSLVLSGKTLFGVSKGSSGGEPQLVKGKKHPKKPRNLANSDRIETYGKGNIFAIDTNGKNYRDVYVFAGPNGTSPEGTLALSADGKRLYGSTYEGGPLTNGGNGYGIVFGVDTNGFNFQDLYNFNDTNGSESEGGVTLSGTKLYVMTNMGGPYHFGCGLGTLISVSTDGDSATVLFNFNYTNGANPQGNVYVSGDSLYGLTPYGGNEGEGNIFKYILPPGPPKNTTGIPTITNASGILVYPNPSNGQFSIVYKVNTPATAEFYNVMGQKVSTQSLNPSTNNVVDLSNDATGVYMYRIISLDGNLLDKGNVVIEK